MEFNYYYRLVACGSGNAVFRSFDPTEFGNCGNMYVPGFGWINDQAYGANKYLWEDNRDLIEGTWDPEKAKQYIRDLFKEEPVNFDLPARHFDKYVAWVDDGDDDEELILKKLDPEQLERDRALGYQDYTKIYVAKD